MIMLAPFSEPVGWLSTTNSTRALEPTLSWNQLHSEPFRWPELGVMGFSQPPGCDRARRKNQAPVQCIIDVSRSDRDNPSYKSAYPSDSRTVCNSGECCSVHG